MKTQLIMAVLASGVAAAAEFRVPVAASQTDALEPSVRNEVDHAVSLGYRWLEEAASTNDVAVAAKAAAALDSLTNSASALPDARYLPFPTGSLARAAAALQLVGAQRACGRWDDPATNRADAVSATAAALGLLQSL